MHLERWPVPAVTAHLCRGAPTVRAHECAWPRADKALFIVQWGAEGRSFPAPAMQQYPGLAQSCSQRE